MPSAPRARRLANALDELGLLAGDAVGTLAWNNHRHLEAYYAVSGGTLCLPGVLSLSPQDAVLPAVPMQKALLRERYGGLFI